MATTQAFIGGSMITTPTSAETTRAISRVDLVLRMMLEEADHRIDGLVTFNPGDFGDSCRKRRVVMIQRPDELADFPGR